MFHLWIDGNRASVTDQPLNGQKPFRSFDTWDALRQWVDSIKTDLAFAGIMDNFGEYQNAIRRIHRDRERATI